MEYLNESFEDFINENLKSDSPKEKITVNIDMAVDDEGHVMKVLKKFKLKAVPYKYDGPHANAYDYEVTGKKQDIIDYLQSKYYELEDEDVQDMYAELLESLNEGRVQYKRKYTERNPSKTMNTNTKIRSKILSAVGDGVLTEDELKGILKELNANPRWFKRNANLFKISENGICLSKTGRRMSKHITPKVDISEEITESRKNDYERQALDMINSFKGGYDSNILTLRSQISNMLKLKSKISNRGTRAVLVRHISNMHDVIEELQENLSEEITESRYGNGLKHINFIVGNSLPYTDRPFFLEFTNKLDIKQAKQILDKIKKDKGTKKMKLSWQKGEYNENILQIDNPTTGGLSIVFTEFDDMYGKHGSGMGWHSSIKESFIKTFQEFKAINEAAKPKVGQKYIAKKPFEAEMLEDDDEPVDMTVGPGDEFTVTDVNTSFWVVNDGENDWRLEHNDIKYLKKMNEAKVSDEEEAVEHVIANYKQITGAAYNHENIPDSHLGKIERYIKKQKLDVDDFWDAWLEHNHIGESLTEGAISDIDIIAQESKDFAEFKKEVLKEYKNRIKPGKETDKWLKELWDESVANNEGFVNEDALTVGEMGAMVIALALSTRLAFMPEDKLNRLFGTVKALGKITVQGFKAFGRSVVRSLPIIGKKIRKKEADAAEAEKQRLHAEQMKTDIERYIAKEMSDDDIIGIFKEDPELLHALKYAVSKGGKSNTRVYVKIKKYLNGHSSGNTPSAITKLMKKLNLKEILLECQGFEYINDSENINS